MEQAFCMKVYFVTDSDENENCMIFRDKASARNVCKQWSQFECEPVLHTISFAPNKKGIIRAMEQTHTSRCETKMHLFLQMRTCSNGL